MSARGVGKRDEEVAGSAACWVLESTWDSTERGMCPDKIFDGCPESNCEGGYIEYCTSYYEDSMGVETEWVSTELACRYFGTIASEYCPVTDSSM